MRQGSVKASVLPEPVSAMATTSRPEIDTGIEYLGYLHVAETEGLPI